MTAAPHLEDLADSVAREMSDQTHAPVQAAAVMEDEADLPGANKFFAKIRFAWKPEDKAILERIRMTADTMFLEMFADAITVIDGFYESLRMPQMREMGGLMLPVIGTDGRPVWQTDDKGRPIERWDQLTGQDVEYTLANLERIRLAVGPQVNKLMLEALYARTVSNDEQDGTWTGIMDGTQGDKSAKANRDNRVDRYHAFFRFYLYSVADTFLKEINAFFRLLERIRGWQVGNKYT